MNINNQKFAVISGGSSGLAEYSINLLRENGYIVFSLDISYKEIKEKDRKLNLIFYNLIYSLIAIRLLALNAVQH